MQKIQPSVIEKEKIIQNPSNFDPREKEKPRARADVEIVSISKNIDKSRLNQIEMPPSTQKSTSSSSNDEITIITSENNLVKEKVSPLA
jgi:hypothetical protein